MCPQYLSTRFTNIVTMHLFFRLMQGHKQKWLERQSFQRAQQQETEMAKAFLDPFGSGRVQKASQNLGP